eukprot:scaffold6554_cov142-Isochrysis_galbana.AAC.1
MPCRAAAQMAPYHLARGEVLLACDCSTPAAPTMTTNAACACCRLVVDWCAAGCFVLHTYSVCLPRQGAWQQSAPSHVPTLKSRAEWTFFLSSCCEGQERTRYV